MIAHLRGKLISKHPNQAIVEAGGVGYDVAISVPTFSDLPTVGSEVSLHVHTHVREDAIALFGFLHADEKQLFEKPLLRLGGGSMGLASKVSLGKLDARDVVSNLKQLLMEEGFRRLAISTDHALRAGLLPMLHRDPVDRMLVAQALALNSPIVSAAAIFDRYGAQRIW